MILNQGEQYQRLVHLCEHVTGEVKLFKDGITKKWYVTANGKTYSGDCIDGALNQAAQEILGKD